MKSISAEKSNALPADKDIKIDTDKLMIQSAGNPHLTDVIDIEALQKIQDSFARATDVACLIVDSDGQPLTKPSNFNEVCRLVKQTEKGSRRCELSDRERDKLIKMQYKPAYHQCTSCGFVDASAPIYIGDRRVAEWLIGQSNVMNVGRDEIARYAGEIGANIEAVLKAYDEMPRMTLEKFKQILQLLNDIAVEISRLCHNNLLLANEISQRRKAESKLKISESHYQEIFNSVLEGICIVDEYDKIVFANPALAGLFGENFDDALIGKCIYELVDKEQLKVLKEQRSNRKRGKASQYELRQKNSRGEFVDVLISATPRYDENGIYRGSFAAIINITEKKRLEEFACRAQRLEIAGRIAAQVAHDFNNLLSPLIAYPELIKAQLPKKSPAFELLDDIEGAATMMTDINQQLLTLGRRGHHDQEIINLNELIKSSLSSLKSKLSDIKLNVNFSKNLMTIKGSSSQLTRVISNLVHNAIDAMKSKGVLTIRSENYYMDRDSKYYNKIPKGEYIKITIGDKGSGILPEDLPYIFDPFYTTKSADKERGSGLGLSVVHAVMEDHDGFIDIGSEVGKGTSVYLYFPINRAPQNQTDKVTIVGGTEKILVIDDDIMQRKVTSNLLKKLGYAVSKAEDYKQALELIENEAYDLIIIDMVMPDKMDGAMIYGEILKLYPYQKAIIVSGYAETDRINKAFELGAGTFLKKPLTLKSLALAVRGELDKIN